MMYAENDEAMCNSPFPDQVKELVFNLHMILRDTVNLIEYKEVGGKTKKKKDCVVV